MKKAFLVLFFALCIFGCYSTEIISSSVIDSGQKTNDCLRYPVVYMPSDREVIPGQTVNLRLVVHPLVCPDEVRGFEWSQITGPSVYLTNNGSDNTSFIAPPEYDDIILRVRVRGKEFNYEDTVLVRVVDRIENLPPYADADGDIKIPVNYSHKVSANYSQGTNRSNMKYLWMTVPESNQALRITDNEKMETMVTVSQESDVPYILLLEVVENGLRSGRNIKLVHTNTDSKSVITAPRFQAYQSEISVPANSSVNLQIKDIADYNPVDIVWYQLSGEPTDIKKSGREAVIQTSEYVDELVFAAFVNVEGLFSPPVLFRIFSGRSAGGVEMPVANAGSDQKVKALSEVKLNGSKSTVSYPRKIYYRWKQVYGNYVNLRDSDTAFPSFSAPRVYGKLIFILTVSDGYVISRPDSVVIEISN
ncbi:MAG: hypothetical protein N3B13_05425 [Deltaproteobacteria bacterium]|nr:hypothetical protein [Deltaproteobacteria bacterium]